MEENRSRMKNLQRSGGIVDGVRAEGENRAVKEVKHRHRFLFLIQMPRR